MNEDKLHWYVFCFFDGKRVDDVVSGWLEKPLNMARMKEAKEAVNMPEKSVIVNCTYLGYMTEEECKGKE